MLPLTKGHLSNKNRIVWQKGCPHYRGTTVLEVEFGNFTPLECDLDKKIVKY